MSSCCGIFNLNLQLYILLVDRLDGHMSACLINSHDVDGSHPSSSILKIFLTDLGLKWGLPGLVKTTWVKEGDLINEVDI